MTEEFLYQKIAEKIRQDILAGVLKPGDRLLSVREMAGQWSCTIGTIQHAYQELVQQGLVTSRAGQGTRVVDTMPTGISSHSVLRKATLFHRAEAFLLEVLTAGYTMEETDAAVRQAMDRWRLFEHEAGVVDEKILRFVGSHDLVVSWLASHFSEIAPGYSLQLRLAGSLGGLLALADDKADIAGSHLRDEESGEFNLPYVRRFFPGQKMALVILAHRRLGLILPAGNPRGIGKITDLARPGLRFANRQAGSGTRVWLDVELHNAGIQTDRILGYHDEKMTHFAVARVVAENQADAGIGLEAAARSYGLDFVWLTNERYDLVMPGTLFDAPPVQHLVNWLRSDVGQAIVTSFTGYDTAGTGRVLWVG